MRVAAIASEFMTTMSNCASFDFKNCIGRSLSREAAPGTTRRARCFALQKGRAAARRGKRLRRGPVGRMLACSRAGPSRRSTH